MKHVLLRVLKGDDEVPRIPRRPDEDLRDYPTYTIPEAAIYLAVPRRTLYHWVSDHPLWQSAGSADSTHLLSFQDIAQSYFLDFIRQHAGISVRKAREILRCARHETGKRYPLLDRNIKFLFRHIILTKPARGRRPRFVVDLSQYPQYVMPEVADLFATRIDRTRRGEVARIFPWRHYRRSDNGNKGDESRPVSIDPDILSGRLVVTGTRIPAVVVLSRKEAGETIPEIARDYGLPDKAILNVVRHLGLPQAA